MKNKYVIQGDTTVIYCTRRGGIVIEAIIDTIDLPKANKYPGTWFVSKYKTGDYYVKGHLAGNRKGPHEIRLHRYLTQCPKGYDVDHINHNTLDNRRSNLRIATRSENIQNIGRLSSNKSGVRGVHWHKRIKKWAAQVKSKEKMIHVGYFDDLRAAEIAVKEARNKLMPFSPEARDVSLLNHSTIRHLQQQLELDLAL